MNWLEVWTRKGLDASSPDVDPLEAALALDGFGSVNDSALPVSTMLDFAAHVLDVVAPRDGDSLYEVGCGSGAFLGAIDRVRPRLLLGGCDYTATLVAACHRLFPQVDSEVREAVDLPLEPSVTHVVSFGVFHYFPDLGYASTVVGRMCAKSQVSVSILDVPDLALRSDAEDFRRGQLSEGEYDARYAGLGHLYYDGGWLAGQFPADEWSVSVERQRMEGYLNTPFRYNVFAHRRTPSRKVP